MNKIVSIVLLLNSFACVVAMDLSDTTSDPFEKANGLYDQSEWKKAAGEYASVFKDTGVSRELSKDAIQKEADSLGVTREQLIRGHVNYGDVLLALSEFEPVKFLQALPHRQYRQYDGQFGRKPLANEWDGSDPSGKTIVVYSERAGEAFGDTFFASFLLRWLKDCGANVIFAPQKLLTRLYSTPGTVQSTYVDKVVVRGGELPAHDSSTYLWSIFEPYVKARGEHAFPVGGSWLSGKDELSIEVQKKLREHAGKLLIGLWWRSAGVAAKAADYRSLDRDPGADRMFKALRGIPGVTLISLEGMGHRPVSQKEYDHLNANDALGNLDPIDITTDNPSEIVTFDSEKFDKENGAFVDTTSVMQYIKQNKGLLIGGDTGLLNLAAAIGRTDGGKPSTFAILNEQADMRWGAQKGRRKCAFSNDIEIFQCREQGKWKEPLEQIHEEVKKRAEELARKNLS